MRSQKIEGLSLNWVVSESKDDETSSGYYDAIWAQNRPTTRYYYDGQMACEEDYTNGSTHTTTRYGIGARGVDYIAKTASSTTVAYPLYDAHGNMIATVNTSGTLADGRYYDAWGNVIGSGSATGEPKGRYCANLGHVQDDESGLIYMRARYYEPWSGRFVSEDALKAGTNWFSYAFQNPIGKVDPDGEFPVEEVLKWLSGLLGASTAIAKMSGATKQLDAILGAFTGLVNAINFTMRACIAAEGMADSAGGGGKGALAAVGTFAAWKLLGWVAMLYFGANLRWFIELYNDPDADVSISSGR